MNSRSTSSLVLKVWMESGSRIFKCCAYAVGQYSEIKALKEFGVAGSTSQKVGTGLRERA